MYGMRNSLPPRGARYADPRIGQWWRDILYGARGPRAPFPDPPPAATPEEPAPPPPLNQTPFGPPLRPPTQTGVDFQRSLFDALRRPGQSPVTDIPTVRLPARITCVNACALRAQPYANAAVVAQLGAGMRLTRIGSPILAPDGAAWVEASAEVADNFNVRTVRGFVRLGELEEGPVLAPPPPADGQGPPIATTPVTAPEPSFLRTAGQVALLTAPAWGAFLYTRFFR